MLQKVRKTFSVLADNSWFLLFDDIFFAALFGGGSLMLSYSQSPIFLLSALGVIGCLCMDRVFGDLESQITVVLLFFSAFVVSGVNYQVGAVMMGVPVGLSVALVFQNWIDQPNRESAAREDIVAEAAPPE